MDLDTDALAAIVRKRLLKVVPRLVRYHSNGLLRPLYMGGRYHDTSAQLVDIVERYGDRAGNGFCRRAKWGVKPTGLVPNNVVPIRPARVVIK